MQQAEPGGFSELAKNPFESPVATPSQPGRDDGCLAVSPSTGVSVSVDLWSEHGDLEDDIVRLGSPAASTSTSEARITGLPALTAAAEIDGRQMSDLVVLVEDRVLVVLVQPYAVTAESTTPEDGLELAEAIAEKLLEPV